jgi:hypothetical protein
VAVEISERRPMPVRSRATFGQSRDAIGLEKVATSTSLA